MGLDAYILCDCFAAGRLKSPPPFPDRISLDETGDVELRPPSTLEEDLAFDDWRFNQACPHEGFILLRRRLGNLWGVQWIREMLHQISRDPGAEFPILRGRVVHSGSHGGDSLTLAQVSELRGELDRLRNRDLAGIRLSKGEFYHTPHGTVDKTAPEPSQAGDLEFIRGFLARLEELVTLSLKVGRPIRF
jgi:hypothetical protein